MELKKLSGILSFTKSTSYQTLRSAQVMEGKLRATDLTTFLTIKNFCGLSDGYYSASDLKVKRLDETVGEFPMFDAYLSAKEMISIDVKTLETFMLHASNDLTRIYLNTVVFDKKTNACKLVSENGIVTFEIPNTDIKVPVGHSDRLDKFEAGFNFKYLEICCEKMKAFTVKYNNELSPVVIDDNRIIMPIKLDKIIK